MRENVTVAKDAFKKLNKVLKNRKISLETKIIVLISILLHGSECWIISSR